MLTDEEKEAAVLAALDDIMSGVGAKRVVRTTDFFPLPQSEWTEQERAMGYRVVCERDEVMPDRLNVFVQFAESVPVCQVDLDFGFFSDDVQK